MSEYTLEEIRLAIELKRIAPNWEESTTDELVDAFAYFCRTYVKISVPSRRIPFELRPAQIDTVRAWIDERKTVVLKARQIGYSTLAGVFSLWATLFYDDRKIIMISRREKEAIDLLAKSKYAYTFLPDWLKMMTPMLVADTLTKMAFSNGSELRSEPSLNDPARGQTAWAVFVDEVGQLPNSRKAWASIEPVADVGGAIHLLGTAQGVDNLLYDIWIEASGSWKDREGRLHKVGTGTNEFVGIFFGWWANSDRDDDWYESRKNNLPEWQLHQEYPSNPDEAFVRSGRTVFDVDIIQAIEFRDPEWRGRLVDLGRGIEFVEDGGPLRVWKQPVNGNTYVIGADVAEGLEHGDYSVAFVINAVSKEVVAIWHGHIDPDLFGEDVLFKLHKWYNGCLVGVESNNHGLTTLKALQRAGCHNIYRQRRLQHKNPRATEQLGWRTTPTSKPLAVDELGRAIRQSDITFWCAETGQELRTFVRDEDGKMHGSPHDDRVMAFAIAVQMLHHVWLPEYRPKHKPGPGTIQWFVDRFTPSEQKERKSPFSRFGVRGR